MKTILIGLGNPILGDDGVGWKVVEEISKFDIRNSDLDIDCCALGGLSLMERLIGYDRAIIVDALQTGKPVGAVNCFRLEELDNHSTGHTTAAHDTSLATALTVGRSMGEKMPDEVFVIGIEAERVYEFTEALTPSVAAAIPHAVEAVLNCLGCPA